MTLTTHGEKYNKHRNQPLVKPQPIRTWFHSCRMNKFKDKVDSRARSLYGTGIRTGKGLADSHVDHSLWNKPSQTLKIAKYRILTLYHVILHQEYVCWAGIEYGWMLQNHHYHDQAETERSMCAIQDQIICARFYQNIMKQGVIDIRSTCHESKEAICHIIAGCPMWA